MIVDDQLSTPEDMLFWCKQIMLYNKNKPCLFLLNIKSASINLRPTLVNPSFLLINLSTIFAIDTIINGLFDYAKPQLPFAFFRPMPLIDNLQQIKACFIKHLVHQPAIAQVYLDISRGKYSSLLEIRNAVAQQFFSLNHPLVLALDELMPSVEMQQFIN